MRIRAIELHLINFACSLWIDYLVGVAVVGAGGAACSG